MPDPTTEATPPQETPPTTETPSADSPEATPAREAARYRTRLRETEAERDTLAGQVQALRDAEIDRALAEPLQTVPEGAGNHAVDPASMAPKPVRVTLAHPTDLFTVGGVDRADLLDDDGQVDPAKVAAALTELHRARPDLFTRGSGLVGTIGKVPTHASVRPSWEGAFTPKRRGIR